jgi:hypothetical protein
MRLRLTDEQETWSFECPLNEITVREQVLLGMLLQEKNPELDERFRLRLAEFLPRALLDALAGSVSAPSDEQVEYAREISEYMNIKIPDLALRYRDFMSAFIREYLLAYYLSRAIDENLVDST